MVSVGALASCLGGKTKLVSERKVEPWPWPTQSSLSGSSPCACRRARRAGNRSLSVAFVDDLAQRFPSSEDSLVSWTLDGPISVSEKAFTDAVVARLRKDKSPLMVKFVHRATRVDATGKQVKDPRKVVEGDGNLLLGIMLKQEPVVKAPKRGHHRHSIDLRGSLESVRVEPKAQPNEINL